MMTVALSIFALDALNGGQPTLNFSTQTEQTSEGCTGGVKPAVVNMGKIATIE